MAPVSDSGGVVSMASACSLRQSLTGARPINRSGAAEPPYRKTHDISFSE
ncbi:hypothetical protein ATI02_6075 [Pseudomonas baetica]|uniref:Uncharacterized protein n=1 Tax=Pseudomonas baetica TaxID=674054 RepID=A0ABX4Q855_9PSED|nr:hypothetical protein ATI02_6075 [Pseudomonas baetica]